MLISLVLVMLFVELVSPINLGDKKSTKKMNKLLINSFLK